MCPCLPSLPVTARRNTLFSILLSAPLYARFSYLPVLFHPGCLRLSPFLSLAARFPLSFMTSPRRFFRKHRKCPPLPQRVGVSRRARPAVAFNLVFVGSWSFFYVRLTKRLPFSCSLNIHPSLLYLKLPVQPSQKTKLTRMWRLR